MKSLTHSGSRIGEGAPGALERPSYTQLEKTLNGPDVSATSQSKMLLFTCAEILKVQYTASSETAFGHVGSVLPLIYSRVQHFFSISPLFFPENKKIFNKKS